MRELQLVFYIYTFQNVAWARRYKVNLHRLDYIRESGREEVQVKFNQILSLRLKAAQGKNLAVA